MKFLSVCGLCCLFSTFLSAQNCFNGNENPTQEAFNMTLLANWDDETLPSRDNGEVIYNDIWGYSAPDPNDPNKMREYAIIGSTEKIHVFEITDTEDDPNNLREVANFTGGASAIWRDFKTYGHYAYCVADEGSEGLIILDLSGLPNSVEKVYQSTEFFNRTHNVFVDNDRLYAVGQGQFTAATSVIVLDIGTDPANPTLMAQPKLVTVSNLVVNGYVHDIYVKDNIAYCSHIFDRVFAVWDFTNPTLPTILSGVSTPNAQHSSWLTEDGKYSIYAEETGGAPLGVIDVSDLSEIQVEHTFKMPLLVDAGHENNVAHNPFIRGNYLYVAYYEDGVQVFDISNPLQPTRVGWYDTFRCNTDYNNFNGHWGVYPFFDSNKIIASDTRNGLFVVMLNEDLESDALPVELVNFSGTLQAQQVELTWTTHSEMRDVQFVVEKQMITDNDNWQALGEVAGKGNMAAPVRYTFTDEKPELGNNYYRLAQYDAAGEVSYSEVVTVNYQSQEEVFQVYSNVIASENTLDFVWQGENTNSAQVQLIAINGQLIQQFNYTDLGKGVRKQLIFNNLAKGIYWVKLSTEQGEWIQRVIKI